MPIVESTAWRNTNFNSSIGSLSVSFAGGNAAVAGDLIIIAANIGDTIANTTKPTGSTDLFGPLNYSGGPSLFCMAKIATGGETGVTWSHSGAVNEMDLFISRWTGALSPLSIDQATTNPSDSATHISWDTGTTAATTQADDLIIGALSLNGAATSPSVTPGALICNIDSNKLMVAALAVSSTGTQLMTFSWTNVNIPQAGIVAIKAAPVVATDDGWEVCG